MNRWLWCADQMRDHQQGDTQHLEQPVLGEYQQRQAGGGGGGGADPPGLALAEVGGGGARQFRGRPRVGARQNTAKPARPHSAPVLTRPGSRRLYKAARIKAKPTATTRLPPVVDRMRCQPSSGAQASALCS